MTDEPKTPPESGDTSPSESDETRRAADTSPTTDEGKVPGSPASAAAVDAGELPPPPDAERPRPTPESQAALTGKAPSGSSTSGTTVPASTGETEKSPAPSPKPPAAPPSNETPEEKKARLERVIA